MSDTPLPLKAHPPERRQRSMLIAPCGCCCCCCCCLHSVGSLVGAGIASRVGGGAYLDRPVRSEAEFWAGAPQMDRVVSEQAAVRIYWYLLTLAAALVGVGTVMSLGDGRVNAMSGHLIWSAIILLLVLPLVQLGVAVLAVFVVGFASAGWIPDKGAALGRIGKITGAMLAGAAAGIGVMVVLGMGLGLMR